MSRWSILGVLVFAACGGKGTVNGGDDGGDGPGPTTDADADGVPDDEDNCADVANPDQTDGDADLLGDACDDLTDADADAVDDGADNCAGLANPDQADLDGDQRGDPCDNCPSVANPDQADTDADAIGDACPCDTCGSDWCTVHPDAPTEPLCTATCLDERQGADGVCCPLGARADRDGNCPLPDIWLDEQRLMGSLYFDRETFDDGDCEVVEACVNGTGQRSLLKFDTRTPNTGLGDLFLGVPDDNPGIFEYSACHGHDHFVSYAVYELLDAAGNVVAPGRKQAFCLLDWEPLPGNEGDDWEYTCDEQGISAQWADVYSSYLDCQFLDVTDVVPGDYTLRVTLNGEHVLAESDYVNNVSEIAVTIPAQ